jgi:predicted tellurium resistance membrane protein TerC
MIIAGAALIMAILDRLPILVWLGAVLLGWIGGAVIATDPAVAPRLHAMLNGDISINIDTTSPLFGFVEHLRLGGEVDELIFAVLGVAFVLVIGTIWRRRKLEEMAATSTEAEVAPATT